MSIRVLLVGPPDPQFEEMKAAFEQAGYLTQTAGNGIDGLKVGSDFRPHLVISEVLLSGMDGLELCSRISQAEGFHTKVILYTHSFRDAKSREEIIYKHGALHYFVKPFQKDALWEAVTKLLREINPQNEKVPVKRDQALSLPEKTRNVKVSQGPVESSSGVEYGSTDPDLTKTTSGLTKHSPPPQPTPRKREVSEPISEKPSQKKSSKSELHQTENSDLALEMSFLTAFENKARSIPKLKKMLSRPDIFLNTRI